MRYLVSVTAMCALAILATPGQAQRVPTKDDIDRQVGAIITKGGMEAVDRYLAEVGFQKISSNEGEASGLSNGSAVPGISVNMYRSFDGQGRPAYYVITGWNWTNNTWDYVNGPEDVVAINFEDQNGQPLTDTVIDDGHRLWRYYKNGTMCGEGSVWHIDNATKGIIYKYQDYTTLLGGDMCGDQIYATAWVLSFPPTRPIISRVHFEHNWTSGSLSDATLELGTGMVKLKVSYSTQPAFWQKEAQLVTQTLP